jgi:hypothetical protein
MYDQFAVLDTTTQQKSRIRLARHAGGFAYLCWAEGHDLEALQTMTREFSTYLGIDPNASDENAVPIGRVQQWLDEIVASAREVSDSLTSANIWTMSPQERWSLMQKWREEIGTRTVLEKTAEIHRRHQLARDAVVEARQRMDVRCLLERECRHVLLGLMEFLPRPQRPMVQLYQSLD